MPRMPAAGQPGGATVGMGQSFSNMIGNPFNLSPDLTAVAGGGHQGDPVGIGGTTGMSPTGEVGGGGTPGSIGSVGGGGMEGASAYGGGETGDVGPGIGGEGTYICTELHRQGLMSDEIYEADAAFGRTLPDEVMEGYSVFAIPVARWMAKSRLLTAVIKPFALRWANHMAGSENWFGKWALKAGIPFCRFLAKTQELFQARKNLERQQHQA